MERMVELREYARKELQKLRSRYAPARQAGGEEEEGLLEALALEEPESYRAHVVRMVEKEKLAVKEAYRTTYAEELYELFLSRCFYEKFMQKREGAWIQRKRRNCGDRERKEGEELFGMALSGGGIRSATFNLGLIQALQRYDVFKSVDILSTVSGGGYIGASQTWLHYMAPDEPYPFGARREDHAKMGGRLLAWLRDHGKYLTPGDGLGSVGFAAAFLGAVLLNLAILAPLFLFAVFLLYLAAPLHLFDGALLVAALFYLGTVVFTSVLSVIGRRRSFTAQRKGRQVAGAALATAAMLGAAASVPWVYGYLAAHLHDWLGSVSLASVAGGAASYMAAYRRQGRGEAGGSAWPAAVMSAGIVLVLYGVVLWLYHLIRLDAPGREAALPLAVAFGASALIVLLARWLAAKRLAFAAAVAVWLIAAGWYLYAIIEASHTPGGVELFFFLALPFSALLAAFANINYAGMHRYYRNRLMEAYFPWRVMGVDEARADRFLLKEMAPSKTPYPLVNTNVNMVGSARTKPRERGGDNFILSPLFSGSAITGYRETERFAGGGMNLATAMAISGAAVDPNTYATRSKPVSFVMSLLNARLGYWIENPRRGDAERIGWSYYLYIFKELFGRGLNERERYVHLADGGHFENLGAYELIRRRCRYILVSDAGRDEAFTFGDLAKLIERVRVDFGAKVALDTRPLRPEGPSRIAERAFVHGTVEYDDGTTGSLLFVKTTMVGGLGEDLYSYRRTNPAFPDQSTGDQFFDEAQFEAYRELGYQVGKRLCGGERVADFRAIFHEKGS